MPAELLGAAVMAMLIAGPLLIDRYLRQLPVAPACPACRGMAREAALGRSLVQWLPVPALARTFVGECSRCGWRGRMRWRFAPEAAGRDDRG
jgi:hypothetical protein